MPHTEKTIRKHPHVNPMFKRFGNQRASNRRFVIKIPHYGKVIHKVSMSKYLPHDGKKQVERQSRQKALGLNGL